MKSDVDLVHSALHRLDEALRTRARRDAAVESGVTENQLALLSLLDDRDPVMVGELAEHMGVTPSTTSLNLTRLEQAGLVDRARDPHDRRVMNVRLTERGLAVRDRGTLLDPGRLASMLATLRPDERRRAVAGLALLADAAGRWVGRVGEQSIALGDEGSRGEEPWGEERSRPVGGGG